MDWMKDLLDTIASSHPDLKNAGFAHVANVGELSVDEPYLLADGLYIRKANRKEAGTLKSLVNVTLPLSPMIPRRNPYETKLHSEETRPGSVLYSTTDLPEEEWRYHVIKFQGTNATLHDFIAASVLTQCRLELGPTVIATPMSQGLGIISGGPSLKRVWDEMAHNDDYLLHLGTSELDDLRMVFQKLNSYEDDRIGLRGAIDQITQLDQIPKGSPLRFLGYVSVLESLIAHAPHPKDPADSLTRQVRQKMLLIGRRCVIPIPYELFGDDVDQKTLWNRLYEYRSKIAHGATPDFRGRLQCLKDPDTALEFISRATVALMRQAIEEPDLIADLRAC